MKKLICAVTVLAVSTATHAGCPWDCAGGDGEVGIVDFLALLGQWGSAGSCNVDQDGTVGFNDQLDVLASSS